MIEFSPPLAGIDPGLIKILIVLVIVIVSVLGNAINKWREWQQGQGRRMNPARPNPPPPRPNRPQDPVADEIGEFLRRAAQRRAPPEQPAKPSRAAGLPSAKHSSRGLGERPAEPILLEAEPDGGVAEHVREHIGTPAFGRLDPELGKEVAQADEKIESRLHSVFDHQISRISAIPGEAAKPPVAESAPAPATGAPLPVTFAAGLAAMLADPGSLRQAILLREIIERPEQRWG